MYVVVSNNGTSTYVFNCVVCFKFFSVVGVLYISYGGVKKKIYKIGGCYSVRMTRKEKLVLYENSVNSIPLRS
jgi:hypothetical protein